MPSGIHRKLFIPGILICFLFTKGCTEDFLNITPVGVFDEAVLATFEGVDALLIGAYSMVDGVSEGLGWESTTSGWVYGSIRGMESNKDALNFPSSTCLSKSMKQEAAACTNVLIDLLLK